MSTRTLDDLSDSELQQLSKAYDSGKYSEKEMSIIDTLDDKTLKQLGASYDEKHSKSSRDSSLGGVAVDTINSAGAGIRTGTMDAVGAMGDLAANILKISSTALDPTGISTKFISDYQKDATDQYGKLKDYVNSDPISQEAAQKHPVVNSAAAGTSNVLTGMALSSAAAFPVVKAVSPAINKAFPLSANPTPNAVGLREAGTQGLTAGIMGAAQDPEHPIQGFFTGAAVGVPLGFIGGNMGAKFKRNSDIIDDVRSDAAKGKFDVNSLGVANKTRKELISGGQDLTREELIAESQKNVQSALKLDPASVSKAKVDATYAPLNKAPAKDIPVNSKNAIAEFQDNTPSLGLPRKPLSEEMSIKDLMDYRKRVGNLKNAAWRQVGNGTMSHDDALMYSRLHKAVTKDIESLAHKQGLGDQFNIAQKLSFDTSLKGQLSKAYEMSLTADEGRLNLRRFDTKITKIMNDPKVSKNKEVMKTVKGVKKIVSYGRGIVKGTTQERQMGWIESMYKNLLYSDGGVAIINFLGSKNTSSQVFRDTFQKLIIGTAVITASPSQAEQNQNTQQPMDGESPNN